MREILTEACLLCDSDLCDGVSPVLDEETGDDDQSEGRHPVLTGARPRCDCSSLTEREELQLLLWK